MNKFTVLIILIVIGFVGLIYFASQNSSSQGAEAQAQILAIQEDDHVQGNRDAEVVLVEYADFECPACQAFHPIVQEVVANYGDEVAVVYRHFPLPIHNNSQTAAWAAEAAGEQGQFVEMSDLLYKNQREWSGKVANVSLFEVYAQELNLDMEQYKQSATSAATKARVSDDLAESRSLGLNSTPSFFLNGEKLSGVGSYDDLARAINQALEAEQDQEEEQADNNNTQIANPAAEYCEEVGGVYSPESGECGFADGSTEDAWVYFRANADVDASGEAESN